MMPPPEAGAYVDNRDSDGLTSLISELEGCLAKMDAMGLIRLGALLDEALGELRSLQRAIDVMKEAGHRDG